MVDLYKRLLRRCMSCVVSCWDHHGPGDNVSNGSNRDSSLPALVVGGGHSEMLWTLLWRGVAGKLRGSLEYSDDTGMTESCDQNNRAEFRISDVCESIASRLSALLTTRHMPVAVTVCEMISQSYESVCEQLVYNYLNHECVLTPDDHASVSRSALCKMMHYWRCSVGKGEVISMDRLYDCARHGDAHETKCSNRANSSDCNKVAVVYPRSAFIEGMFDTTSEFMIHSLFCSVLSCYGCESYDR